ncbi:6-phosphogluconate dehydrogenase C-terminal domain-like protein [Dacryopinax primogenitus]|uniref:6-phosphogluconate dehydrogenase C-terminal domain-like protein n=1 Tax=Dacryopinax primogenitus (strain DJM 731) TaxID=1858805 RepID=M5FNQ3_DACPD|nr:6-phosphogluconate dehydrogenase C-terminal domain-like protein [Dacryopinax primogenitus]EJT97795.1 6-phosphogluconate dehydrogenase C-terminal domain-like protein [Dacryopinax primogenitus]
MSALVIAVVSPGAMGSAIGARLSSHGVQVLTHIPAGRSQASHDRATKAGMHAVSLAEISKEADWVLSVLPPDAATDFATLLCAAYNGLPAGEKRVGKPAFADLNAVNPSSVVRISQLFDKQGVNLPFVDGSIIGGPPKGEYDPIIYASADTSEEGKKALDEFEALQKFGLKIGALRGEGAGVGAASALKMAYAGITKGTTGLAATMILAAYHNSPGTAEALIAELSESQPLMLQRFTKGIPDMLPKAYRFHGEMQEISGFVVEEGGGGSGDIHKGLAATFRRLEQSIKEDGTEVKQLKDFIQRGEEVLEAKKKEGSNGNARSW